MYIVRFTDGFYEAKNKKDAMEVLRSSERAMDIIFSKSKTRNYYHNRIKIVASK